MKQCRKCGVELTNENWYLSYQKKKNYICKGCQKKTPKTKMYTKLLYSDAKESIQLSVQLLYYPKSAHTGFVTGFGKSAVNGGSKTNKDSTAYLGIHIAERVLSHIFKNVKRMPNNHKGYDVICGCGYMIDIKSSCRHVKEKCSDLWQFNINKNTIADHFLCLAFDNRKSLNPEHIWLIPGKDVNDKTKISISGSTIHKWDKYKLDKIKEIINCCNILKK